MSPAIITVLILAVAIVIFVTEKLPMGLTAFLVSLALYLFGIIDSKILFSSVINSNVILIVAMCVIGEAFFKTGMAYKTGNIITHVAKTERSLIVWIMLVGGIMSGFLSNTGTVAVLIPIVIGISSRLNIKPSKLLIPLCIAASIGADLSLIGSPGNLIAKAGLEEATGGTMTFGFFEYSKLGIPLLALSIAFMYFFGYKLLPDRTASEYIESSQDYSHIPPWKGYVTLIVLIGTILAMIGEELIGIPLHISAAIGAALIVVTGVLSEKEAYRSFEMPVVFLLAFMLPLSTALSDTGASTIIAQRVIAIAGTSGPLVLTAALYLITNLITQFMSNTAACALLVPIAATISAQMGADPRAAIMAVFIGSSIAVATPLAIPANAMVMGPAGYKFKDFAITGIPLMVICFALSMVLLPIFYPFFPK